MSRPNLATARAVLNWAWTVRHPIKGTIKCGPQYDDVAAYLAECVRLRVAFERNPGASVDELYGAIEGR